MKDRSFIEGPVPSGFKSEFESYLFNTLVHRELQSPSGWKSFHLSDDARKTCHAAVHFCIQEGVASSPFSAPFGSIEFSDQLNTKDLYEFLKWMEQRLRGEGVRKIVLVNPPELYRPASASRLEVLLLNLGYHIGRAEISAGIRIDRSTYKTKIGSWELRKLNQAHKAKLKFAEIPVTEFGSVFDFILTCRKERGHSLSMVRQELQRTVDALPRQFMLFAVTDKNDLAAASISIRVNRRILYNFYSAHPRKWDHVSPVVHMINGMYRWSQKSKVELIDLGTSAVDGQPNFGLLDFKMRLSGVPSAKLTFEKEL